MPHIHTQIQLNLVELFWRYRDGGEVHRRTDIRGGCGSSRDKMTRKSRFLWLFKPISVLSPLKSTPDCPFWGLFLSSSPKAGMYSFYLRSSTILLSLVEYLTKV